MSKDDIRNVADVRRDIWTAGFSGLAIGSAGGLLTHAIVRTGTQRRWWTIPTSRNTTMMAALLGGTLCSFVMATTTGKNEVGRLHPIFELGAVKPSPNYQETLQRARERETELRSLERRRTGMDQVIDDSDHVQRQRNRLYRRASLTRSFTKPGLSDAHGGHWMEDENNERK